MPALPGRGPYADVTVVVGLVAALMLVGALAVRLVETVRAPSVAGLSVLFSWLALVANCGWAAYGWFLNVPLQLYPSLLGVAVFGYSVVRLHREGRPQVPVAMFAVPAAAALVFAASWEPDVTGYTSGLLLVAATVPQLVRVWSTGQVSGVAPAAWATTSVMSALWCLYGLMAGLLPVWSTNLVSTILAVLVLAGWVRALRRSRSAPAT